MAKASVMLTRLKQLGEHKLTKSRIFPIPVHTSLGSLALVTYLLESSDLNTSRVLAGECWLLSRGQ